jgi:hypothetical protein
VNLVAQIGTTSPETVGRIRTSVDDVPLNEVMKRLQNQEPEDWIRRSLYGEVFYIYHRCNWVHELERSEYLGPDEAATDGLPRYENRGLRDEDGKPLSARGYRLVFPLPFLTQTYNHVLNSFEKQCRNDLVDPCTGTKANK